jgi:hypothetical protein
VPEGDLLAVNGLEGMVRPVLQNAAGPAAAGLLVAVLSGDRIRELAHFETTVAPWFGLPRTLDA